MKNVYKQKRQEGFTIIEVLIVLAIAALILLIVFLAVPSLQRNARNTQRKSDVANLGSAISNFEGNNSGALPTAQGYDTGDQATLLLYCKGATPSVTGTLTAGNTVASGTFGCLASNNNFDSAKLGYYKPADNKIFFANSGASPTVAAPGSESAANISTNSVIIDLGFTCNSSSTGPGTASSRSVALLSVAETSTGNGNLQCVQS
jgi:prepilin-type N-terminal cleavage/methylation domain-containing protein